MTASLASLVIGADGLLGRSISDRLRSLGGLVVETRRLRTADTPPLDIATMAASWPLPRNLTTAYFCAAVTSQHECRTAFGRAYAVNVTGTVALIRRLVDAGIFVVFPSSNLVYDGSRPHVPAEAAPCPQTAYGQMKAEVEADVLAVGRGVGVVRLTKVVHSALPVFAEWRTSFRRGLDVRPFYDMVFAPLALSDAASVLINVGQKQVHGITQASSQDDISYAQACRFLAKQLDIPESQVHPVSWRESGRHFEHVPSHTTLDTRRAEHLCGFSTPTAQAVLEEVLGIPNAPLQTPRDR